MPLELVPTDAYYDEYGPMLTERMFARAVGLAEITIRLKRKRGELDYYQFGRSIRYSRATLEDFVEKAHRPATRKR